MKSLLENFTSEPLLFFWITFAPVIGALVSGFIATWLAGRQAREQREHDAQLWREQKKLEKEEKQDENEYKNIGELRQRMEEAYRQFLDGSSRLMIFASASDDSESYEPAFNEFSSGFQRLLLVSSVEVATKAVELWKAILSEVRSNETSSGNETNETDIRKLRAAFVREARLDLEDPVERNANRGIQIKPALTIGGFSLDDVG